MDSKLLSIVVPVYKVEKYLSRCVDSLLEQSYKNVEIILVDDGSPDNCGAICDQYAMTDSRVKVIHQINKGLSGARNAGISVANGEYIAFVDSDDWVESEMYTALMQQAIVNDADIVKCGFDHTTGSDHDYEYIKNNQIYCGNLLENYFKGILWVVVWNGVYRASIAKQVQYPEGLYAEDNYASFFYLYHSKKAIMLSKSYYNYFQNPTSIRYTVMDSWFDIRLEIFEKLRNDIDLLGLDVDNSIKRNIEFLWAKDVYHKIRNNKSIKSLGEYREKNVYSMLDLRRSVSLRLILLSRMIFS